MSSDNPQESALTRALRERRELQDAIRIAAKKLEKVEQFIAMYRQYATGEEGLPELGGMLDKHAQASGWMGQETFGQLVRSLLMDMGRPMESPEIIEKFAERGHPLGRTNVVKQTWNKLWLEKRAGNLIHLPKLGYWLPNEPLTEEAKAKSVEARATRLRESRRNPSRKVPDRTGNPRGRRPTLSDEQLAMAEEWLMKGVRRSEVAKRLGVATPTVLYSFPKGAENIRERRNKPPAELSKKEVVRELAYINRAIHLGGDDVDVPLLMGRRLAIEQHLKRTEILGRYSLVDGTVLEIEPRRDPQGQWRVAVKIEGAEPVLMSPSHADRLSDEIRPIDPGLASRLDLAIGSARTLWARSARA
jgi:hypothetical protein